MPTLLFLCNSRGLLFVCVFDSSPPLPVNPVPLFSLWRGMASKSNVDNSPNGNALRDSANLGNVRRITSLVQAGTNVNGTDEVRRSHI